MLGTFFMVSANHSTTTSLSVVALITSSSKLTIARSWEGIIVAVAPRIEPTLKFWTGEASPAIRVVPLFSIEWVISTILSFINKWSHFSKCFAFEYYLKPLLIVLDNMNSIYMLTHQCTCCTHLNPGTKEVINVPNDCIKFIKFSRLGTCIDDWFASQVSSPVCCKLLSNRADLLAWNDDCSGFRSMLAISAISFVLSSRVILGVLVFLQHNQGFSDHRDRTYMVCWGLSKSEIVLPPRSISNSLLSSSFCSTWDQVICGEVIAYIQPISFSLQLAVVQAVLKALKSQVCWGHNLLTFSRYLFLCRLQ